MKPLKAFRYSGSKARLLECYHRPPVGTKRIVEPYFGSGAYSLNQTIPAIGWDTNPLVKELWYWLRTCQPSDLVALNEVYELEKSKYASGKFDIWSLGLQLPVGAILYLKINVCGLFVGQWSSKSTYPQHKLPIADTIRALPRIKEIKVVEGSGSINYPRNQQPGDLVFIDPPYVGTTGNYVSKNTSHEDHYDPKDTVEMISKIKHPIIFTYGSGAPEIFPDFDWIPIKERSCPNVRKGGSVKRVEYVAYVNWAPESNLENFDAGS